MNVKIVLFLLLICLIYFSNGQEVIKKTISQQKCDQYINEANELSTNSKKSAKFPHMAVLGYPVLEDQSAIAWLCAGSLISDNFILAPAHCVTSPRVPNSIRLGDEQISVDESKKYLNVYKISEIKIHPKFIEAKKYNDIALIKLDKTVAFSENIRPACLWQTNNTDFKTLIEPLWKYEENIHEKVLKDIHLTFVENSDCIKEFPIQQSLSDGILSEQICYRTPKPVGEFPTSIYGPAQIRRDLAKSHIYDVVGSVSFDNPNSITVFTRVASYLDWIEFVVWPNYNLSFVY